MNRPQATREEVDAAALPIWLAESPDKPLPKVYFVMVRGYRYKTMGNPERNDVGIFDDAAFLCTPTKYIAENSNTDPSRLGWNEGVGKPFGLLKSNRVWWFYPGAHKSHRPAFRQADDIAVAKMFGIPHEGRFLVTRMWGWGDPRNYDEWGHQQVDIHRAGMNTTSSWLCLTIPLDRSDPFLQEATDELKKYEQKTIPVILIEGPIV
jgi:lysozyme